VFLALYPRAIRTPLALATLKQIQKKKLLVILYMNYKHKQDKRISLNYSYFTYFSLE
jgi:hypothetical protein